MTPEFKSQIIALLDHHRLMSIATNRPDGWPQVTMVGYANDGLHIYCLVGSGSQKWANIARDPRVSIAIGNDTSDPMAITGLSLAGRAQKVRDAEELKRFETMMYARYPEYVAMPKPDMSLVTILRITPTVVSILDYSKGFAHTDLVEVGPADMAA